MMKTIHFLFFFALNYLLTFFALEWLGDGMMTHDRTWLAANLVVGMWSVLVGFIAVERAKEDEQREEWKRRIEAFVQAGR